VIVDGERIPVMVGQEYLTPRVLHSGEVLAETRTIHAFAGHRVDRLRG
jgi:hypothetical protein